MQGAEVTVNVCPGWNDVGFAGDGERLVGARSVAGDCGDGAIKSESFELEGALLLVFIQECGDLRKMRWIRAKESKF